MKERIEKVRVEIENLRRGIQELMKETISCLFPDGQFRRVAIIATQGDKIYGHLGKQSGLIKKDAEGQWLFERQR